MFHQLQCKNLMEAHLLRSRLLEKDIQSWVVNENAALLYVEALMPPQLLVRDEDWERTQDVMKETPEPLDDSFSPPADEVAESPPPPFHPGLPEILFTITALSCIAGGASLAILLAFEVLGGQVALSDRGASEWLRDFRSVPVSFVLGGAILSAVAWLGISIAPKFRRRADGSFPFGTRWIALLLLLCATEFLVLIVGPLQIFRDLLQVWNGTAF
jgi:hypothetical protein